MTYIPGGGGGGGALATNADVALNNPADGDSLIFDGTTNLWTNGSGGSDTTITMVDQTADYALAAADSGKRLHMTAASGITLRVPLEATASIPVGSVFEIAQRGAGGVDIEPQSGVTLNSPGKRRMLSEQYSMCASIKVATNEWDFVGDLSPLEILDSFTVSSSGNLHASTHRLDKGHPFGVSAPWALGAGSQSVLVTNQATDKITGGTGTAQGWSYVRKVMPTADYTVEVDVTFVDAALNESVGPAARMSSTDRTYYFFYWDLSTATYRLSKYVTGTATNLDSLSDAGRVPTNGQTLRLGISCVGNLIKGFIDGELVCEATDTSIAAINYAGLISHNGTARVMDNFRVIGEA